MATQPPTRPWFRLASIARPAPPPAPVPEAQPTTTSPPLRPPLLRPMFTTSFRPPITQTQEPAPPAPAPPPPPSPPRPAAATTTSVPSSPIGKNPIAPNSSPLPPSPNPKGSPSSTRTPVYSSSSVPPSPKPKILAPIPNSPVPKIIATNSSLQQPNSPSPKISAPSSPVPPSPPPKISSLQPNSPAPKYTFTNSSPQPTKANNSATTTTARLPTPSPSPKFTKQPLAQTPPQSPNIKSNAPPPSPLVLPPSMLNPEAENGSKIPLEAEQKTVLVQQKTIDKPKPSWFNGDSHNHAQKPSIFHGDTNEKGSHTQNKKNSDSEEIGMRVITIAGENRGAFMELSHSSHRKNAHFEGNPHSLVKKNGNESDSSSSDEGKSKMKDKNHNKKATPSPPVSAYMNSNVQGINNSIVFNSSYNHHDPGVHLSLSKKPNGGGHKMFQFKDNANGHHF